MACPTAARARFAPRPAAATGPVVLRAPSSSRSRARSTTESGSAARTLPGGLLDTTGCERVGATRRRIPHWRPSRRSSLGLSAVWRRGKSSSSSSRTSSRNSPGRRRPGRCRQALNRRAGEAYLPTLELATALEQVPAADQPHAGSGGDARTRLLRHVTTEYAGRRVAREVAAQTTLPSEFELGPQRPVVGHVEAHVGEELREGLVLEDIAEHRAFEVKDVDVF